jgi:glycosyltransferase involved in cell wall biosynthesis
MAHQAGLSDCVEWWGWRPQAEVLSAYRQHHAFLFPSLHDSSGNAVLEALSQGLPVVCLANGGPAAVVGPHAGVRVDAADQGVDAVAAALGDAVRGLIEDDVRYRQLSKAALARAADLSWSQVVARVWPPGARNFGEVVER